MKTETRSQILKIIEKKRSVRPSELRQSLKISAQAIHRHLRTLAEQGLVEAKGSAPFTRYVLAGVLNLEAVAGWLNARTLTESPQEWVCETRETLTARLPRLKSFVGEGLPRNLLPLVISTAGEIGNNSFDHNLGQWRDVPGCWFEPQVTGLNLWICIADRGQGVFQSLIKGNELKFVKNALSTTPGSGLACISGTGRVHYGDEGEKCISILDKYFTKVKGTITGMIWKLS